jgi:hypothetical protein
MVFFCIQVKSRRKMTGSPTAISFPKRPPEAVPSPNPPSPPANTSYRQGCGSVFGSAWISINLSCWMRIQECQNDLQMYKKVKNFHVLKCWMQGRTQRGCTGCTCIPLPPPPVHPPPRPCAFPPPQPERLVMRKDEAVGNKKKMQVCLPKHNKLDNIF